MAKKSNTPKPAPSDEPAKPNGAGTPVTDVAPAAAEKPAEKAAPTSAELARERDKVDSTYGAEQIQHLSDLEHVRMRPGMYIGDKGSHGMHHLVYEAVDNSIDEVMAGHAKLISVKINVDGSVTIADDGRGIPVAMHPELGVSTLEAALTMLKTGGKFNKDVYKTSAGLHGVGIKAVTFLSEWSEVEVCREGAVHTQEYSRGKPLGPVQKVGATSKTGTKLTFKPDPEIFEVAGFDYNTLQKRLQQLAFLNQGVKIDLKDERSGEHDLFHYERGLVEYVEYLNRTSEPVHGDVIYISTRQEGIEVEVALQYAKEFTENVHSFVNNIATIMGGTHLQGFRTALTRTLNAYGKKVNLFKDLIPTGDDFREGLTAIVSTRVPEPQFESQTKVRCLNPELEGIVSAAVGDILGKYLEENPKSAKLILEKGLLAAEAREAAKKAKQLLRDRKGALSGGGLPGKLRDCSSKEVDKCELYLVEGDSAGGSAEGGRFREYQAVLPLRGKIINAFKSREDKVLSNEEIRSMISAIGTGIGEDADVSKRRYNKIVIMTDADVDGSHIRTLLLTFFYRQMNHLITGGHIYVAQPPLFRVRNKKQTYYVQTNEQMKTQLLDMGLGESVFEADGKRIEGAQMAKLVRTLAAMEEAIVVLERRGISLKKHAERLDKASGDLPMFHVYLGTEEHWFTSRAKYDEFRKQAEASGELQVVDKPHENGANGKAENGKPNSHARRLHAVELHEVKAINTGLKELKAFGFGIEALIPQERTGTEEPRYLLRRGDNTLGLTDMRSLPGSIREIGEKGLSITRFKGLGEMNPEELKETTLDPANRTLVQIKMEDAAEADNIFRILMGDKVEPRREFIEKHALDVRNLDV